MDVFGILG